MCKSPTRRLSALVVMVLTILVAGCTDTATEPTASGDAPAPIAARRGAASAANIKQASRTVADTAENSPVNSAGNATPGQPPPKTFEPPYPERRDLFQPPKIRRTAATGRESRGGNQQVQLKGFVNVDGIRAILIVNGETNSVAVGDVRQGVEVISIEPPRVTLQRGRVRWTETLR